MFEGFERHDVHVEGATITAFVGGNGPPLLLLHGYPQTHVAWHRIAPVLARDYTVIATDLRGYGDSRGPEQVDASAYSKRAMARDQLAVMKHFGFGRFAVIGHDRGARVGYRLALDYPGTVLAFALVAYQSAFRRPEVRHAMMQDYRAGATVDHEHDLIDRAAGRVLDCPVLVLWEQSRFDETDSPLHIWKEWATEVDGWGIPGGHLQPEEQPEAVLDAVGLFLARKMVA